MGSGSTKKSKEDREPRMDSIQNNNNSDEVSLNKDGETVVDFLQNFENLLQTCSGLFDDGIDAFKWATENSCNLFDQLTRSCLRNTAGGKRHLEREEREEIASKVVISDITKHFTDCLQYIRQNYPDALEKDEKSLKNEFQSLDEEEDSKEKLELTILFQKIICAIVGFFVNNVDVSKNFGGKCVENGTVGILLQYVESYQNICFEEDKTDVKFENLRENKRIQTVNRVLSFHHNISKDFCEHMVKNKAIETMAPYVNSTNPLLAMKSLLVLSHLISEEQNNMITSTDGPISILLQHLEGAAKSNSNRYNGFETSELLMGLSKILQNDQNKKKVGDQGGIEILSQIIYKITSSNSEDENNMKILEFVFNCIYLLSFHEDNKENIMNNGVIVHALHNCSSMNNKSILIDAHGTLWELKDKKTRVPMKHHYMRSKSMKSKKATLPKLRKKSRSHSELEWNENQQLPNARELSVNEPISGGSSETEEKEEQDEEDEQQPEEEEDVVIKEQKLQHIMISYQWSHQPIMLKVRDKLQEEGFTVWIDLDEMKGSTLEAMANAVEDAYLILVTVSSNYKASANTRSEAEYAFQLKKPIIPLMMERDYKADGWLGFIVGSKLWIDFIDENNIESSSLNNLVAEIHRQGFKPDNENEVLKPQPSPQPSTKFNDREELRRKISQWTPDDVRKWITSNELIVNDDVIVKHLDGYVLLHLFDLRKEAPDTFYKFLKKDLALDTLKNLFQFADCLAKLLDDT